MQAMAPEKQKVLIEEKADRRSKLQRKIKGLAEQRSEFIEQKVEKIDDAKDSLDHKIYSAVREQASKNT